MLLSNELVRAMTHRMVGTAIASLGAIALLLAANEAFARSGSAPHGGFASSHPMFRPQAAHAFRPHRRSNLGPFWPAGGFYFGPSNGEAIVDVPQPMPSDIHYTYTYDVPWDWAHRYPPAVAPSDRPYVSSCPAETVTVPGRGGQDHTISIMRCY